MYKIARSPYLDLQTWRELFTTCNTFLHSNEGWYHPFIKCIENKLSEDYQTFPVHKIVLGMKVWNVFKDI